MPDRALEEVAALVRSILAIYDEYGVRDEFPRPDPNLLLG